VNTQRYVGPALVAIALVALLAFAGVNVAAVAPFALILLVCGLMMFFMLRGMNHGNIDQAGHDHPTHAGPGRHDDR
jgi:Protein of unknown function (DUF2933)